ncbi:trypsin-like peptidase domain-containing protein, partial [Cylindrospermopsis raciborskii]|uniref:trypsin-like peptidase domain-containing protein n=1 Tax=Cylindrospermopsis raciborskii TaxID=77022 RepID=UPI0022CC5E05|nr:hypothetical protein [Cylindrospermopsis raciborskii PAMP2011]
MKLYFTIIPSLFLLFFPRLTLASKVPATVSETQSVCNPEKKGEDGAYSREQQEAILRQITVRVIGDNNGGSGTILARKGKGYLVASNSHTLLGVNLNGVRVQTPDGQIYPAKVIPNLNFQKDDLDLTILEFVSDQTYCFPKIVSNEINKQLPVLAAGYSGEKSSFVYK